MPKFINSVGWLLIAILIFVISIPKEIVEGRTVLKDENKAIIKTIKVDKDEIIDCYDILKQLSLNHPSLHNHTIQMRPSIYPKNITINNFGTLQLTQTWHKYGSCPHGTIPIRRNIRKYYQSTLSRKSRRSKTSYYMKPNTLQSNGIRDGHEYAVIRVRGNFLGAQEKINLWNPTLEEPSEMSVSQIWVDAGDKNDLNTIEAGWEVNMVIPRTRFFILWSTNTYKNFCINYECPGFVQTSSDVSLGCNFTEISTFNGGQKDATFSIYKDQNSGNWWIQIQGIPVGYYPSSLFTQLSMKAAKVEFGGEIYNLRHEGRHTTTQMGSGHLPSEGGLGISSYFSHVQVINENYEAKDPEDVKTYVSNPNCYDLKVDKKHTNGYSFYYGGPGYNGNCP
ncbi:hypothetical protein MKX03_008852 [Papaver bracteatum]|nr:hypothetical protein MKX03_008852 [Papaver bracteatum]